MFVCVQLRHNGNLLIIHGLLICCQRVFKRQLQYYTCRPPSGRSLETHLFYWIIKFCFHVCMCEFIALRINCQVCCQNLFSPIILGLCYLAHLILNAGNPSSDSIGVSLFDTDFGLLLYTYYMTFIIIWICLLFCNYLRHYSTTRIYTRLCFYGLVEVILLLSVLRFFTLQWSWAYSSNTLLQLEKHCHETCLFTFCFAMSECSFAWIHFALFVTKLTELALLKRGDKQVGMPSIFPMFFLSLNSKCEK